MDEKLYYLELDYAKSAWRAWQTGCYKAAKKYDRQLFTRQQILALGAWLDKYRLSFRNSEPVGMPDWTFCDQYGHAPQISLGYGCSLTFKPVAGFFDPAAK